MYAKGLRREDLLSKQDGGYATYRLHNLGSKTPEEYRLGGKQKRRISNSGRGERKHIKKKKTAAHKQNITFFQASKGKNVEHTGVTKSSSKKRLSPSEHRGGKEGRHDNQKKGKRGFAKEEKRVIQKAGEIARWTGAQRKKKREKESFFRRLRTGEKRRASRKKKSY